MKKIYLFCDQGMSTSMLAKKMQDIGDKHNLPVEVKAYSIKILEKILEEEHPDCVLLGPQVRHLLEDTENRVEGYNVPVGVVDSVDYGMMDGERVLKKAILMMKNYKK